MPNKFIYRSLPSHQQIPCSYECLISIAVHVQVDVGFSFTKIWLIIDTSLFVMRFIQPAYCWRLGFNWWLKIVSTHDDRKIVHLLIPTFKLTIVKEIYLSKRRNHAICIALHIIVYRLNPSYHFGFFPSPMKLYACWPAHLHSNGFCLHLTSILCAYNWASIILLRNESITFNENVLKFIWKEIYYLLTIWLKLFHNEKSYFRRYDIIEA